MSTGLSDFFSRDELLGGLPARRASMALFAIEARAAHFAARSHQAMTRFVTEKTVEEQEHEFLDAMAHKRDLPSYPTSQDLERFASDWAPLAPDDPGVRAAVARLIAQKYRFRYRDAPRLRAALGLDDPAVQQAYQKFHSQPIDSIYAARLTATEQLRWFWARLAFRLENLPPFTSAFALTLTETVGASILALPIALAGVGPLAGVMLLLILGLVNIITIVGVSEAVVRNGKMRYWSGGYLSELVQSYLGESGSVIFGIALVILIFVVLIAYYVGVATTLEDVTHLRAEGWALALFLINLYFLRSKTFNTTVAFALAVGFANIVLVLAMSAFALPYVRLENLLYFNLPFVNGRPLDISILRLIFGVILLAYFGHTSTANCARIVLRREPTGRALITGNIAAMVTVMGLYSIWIIAVNGALVPGALVGETGTVIGPLADMAGRSIEVLGTLYVVLGMGMASVHYSLGLFNQARQWTPSHIFRFVLSARSRYLFSIAPVVIVFIVIEGLLFANKGTYTGTLGFLGVLKGSLLGGIFPMLMLVASRHKGEYVPGFVIRFLGNRILVTTIYLLFLAGIFLHGLIIWQDFWQRAAAVVVGVVALVMPFVFAQRGAFKPRVTVELRVEQTARHRAELLITSDGQAFAAGVELKYEQGVQRFDSTRSAIRNFDQLRAVVIQLPAHHAQELKLWVHEITEEGNTDWLPAKLEISNQNGLLVKELIDRERILSLNGGTCRVEIQFLPSESAMLQAAEYAL